MKINTKISIDAKHLANGSLQQQELHVTGCNANHLDSLFCFTLLVPS